MTRATHEIIVTKHAQQRLKNRSISLPDHVDDYRQLTKEERRAARHHFGKRGKEKPNFSNTTGFLYLTTRGEANKMPLYVFRSITEDQWVLVTAWWITLRPCRNLS